PLSPRWCFASGARPCPPPLGIRTACQRSYVRKLVSLSTSSRVLGAGPRHTVGIDGMSSCNTSSPCQRARQGRTKRRYNRKQMVRTHIRWTSLVAALVTTTAVSSASAQNYSFDARRIALGGTGGTPNVASSLVERQRRYKSIVIPVGLVRVIKNINVFYPNREDFDFSSAVEYATRPLHQVIGRVRNYPGFHQLVDD